MNPGGHDHGSGAGGGCPFHGGAAKSSVMTRLRDETMEEHKHAESRPLETALFRGALPRDAYVDYLGQRWHVHTALEAAMQRLAAKDARVSGVVRAELMQTPNLEADLAHFGVDAAAVSRLPSTESYVTELIRSEGSELLGQYYVFEGSKNGAKILSRIIGKAYGLTDREGLRYLDPHGEQQRTLWSEFKTAVDAAGFSSGEADAMVRGAKRAFAAVAAIDDAVWERSGRQPAAAAGG